MARTKGNGGQHVKVDKRAAAAAKKQERQMQAAAKRAAAKAEKEAAAAKKRAAAAAKKQEREQKAAAAKLKRQQAQAARSMIYPSTAWEARFWAAVMILHPSIVWDNPSRERVYSVIVPLWRIHRWAPEEAAQAVCLRCEVPTDPPQAAPVASGGRTLTERVKFKRPANSAAAIKPTYRPDLPDLPQVGKGSGKKPKGRSCPSDRGECGYSVTGGACSVSARLSVAGKSAQLDQVPARYCLVEIGQLHTSHLPLRGFRANPSFPSVAQERDYGQQAEQGKVLAIAQDYDPALIFNTAPGAIDGVPVATEEGIVLGGNGRTMATTLVYAGRGSMKPEDLKAHLVEHAAEFGFDADVVEAFAQPMLVRTVRIAQDGATLAAWSRRLNTSLSQQLDAVHLAVSRARFVDDAALRELAAAMSEDETLAAFLSSQRSRPFVRALQAAGVIDTRAAASYLSGGLLNAQGRDLVEDLLVAILLPDADLIGAYGRGPVGSLARAAPYLVMAGQGEGYDLREPLRLAVRDRLTMRASGIDDVAAYLRQEGLFSGTGPAVAGEDRGKVLLQVLAQLEASPAKLGRFARTYAELAAAHPKAQAALFAAEAITPLEALRLAAEQAGVKLCHCTKGG